MTSVTLNNRSALVASLILCVSAGISTNAMAADTSPVAVTHSGPARVKMVEGNTPEARIKRLHDELKITSDQESQWNDIAQVMLANASAIESTVKARVSMSKGMTAIDDLKSYEAIVDAHADGIKKLAVAFAPLYSSMPESQQKNADAVFGHRTRPSKLKTHA